MKKSHFHTVLSTRTCKNCGRRIKQRLVEVKQPRNITRCYSCHISYKRNEQVEKDARRHKRGRNAKQSHLLSHS